MKEIVKPMHFRFLLCLIVLTITALTGQMPARASALVGTIAYVVPNQPDGDQIHLIEPDGSDDRIIYSTENPHSEFLRDIGSMVWKPDASELAFSSTHEDRCSLYSEDIYTIRPDGRGYRRVSGPPACKSRAGLPTGTVIVPVSNGTGQNGPFTFYFEGAPGPVEIALAPGASTQLTFTKVADYGAQNQAVIWAIGDERGYFPNAWADVKPGQTVTTGVLQMGASFKHFGFAWPNYLPDGSTIASVFHENGLYMIDSNNTALGDSGTNLPIDMTLSAYYLAWGPTPDTADMFLFRGWVKGNSSGSPIMLGDINSDAADLFLEVDPTNVGKSVLGITWLPDGSGFLYSLSELLPNYEFGANIWEFSFGDSEPRKVTNVPYGFARQITVSPDGQKILFELQPKGDAYNENPQTELWMVNRNGSGLARFVKNGRSPAWSPQELPPPLTNHVYLPGALH